MENLVVILSIYTTALLTMLSHSYRRNQQERIIPVPQTFESFMFTFHLINCHGESNMGVQSACLETAKVLDTETIQTEVYGLLHQFLLLLIGKFRDYFNPWEGAVKESPRQSADTLHCFVLTLTILGNLILMCDSSLNSFLQETYEEMLTYLHPSSSDTFSENVFKNMNKCKTVRDLFQNVIRKLLGYTTGMSVMQLKITTEEEQEKVKFAECQYEQIPDIPIRLQDANKPFVIAKNSDEKIFSSTYADTVSSKEQAASNVEPTHTGTVSVEELELSFSEPTYARAVTSQMPETSANVPTYAGAVASNRPSPGIPKTVAPQQQQVPEHPGIPMTTSEEYALGIFGPSQISTINSPETATSLAHTAVAGPTSVMTSQAHVPGIPEQIYSRAVTLNLQQHITNVSRPTYAKATSQENTPNVSATSKLVETPQEPVTFEPPRVLDSQKLTSGVTYTREVALHEPGSNASSPIYVRPDQGTSQQFYGPPKALNTHEQVMSASLPTYTDYLQAESGNPGPQQARLLRKPTSIPKPTYAGVTTSQVHISGVSEPPSRQGTTHETGSLRAVTMQQDQVSGPPRVFNITPQQDRIARSVSRLPREVTLQQDQVTRSVSGPPTEVALQQDKETNLSGPATMQQNKIARNVSGPPRTVTMEEHVPGVSSPTHVRAITSQGPLTSVSVPAYTEAVSSQEVKLVTAGPAKVVVSKEPVASVPRPSYAGVVRHTASYSQAVTSSQKPTAGSSYAGGYVALQGNVSGPQSRAVTSHGHTYISKPVVQQHQQSTEPPRVVPPDKPIIQTGAATTSNRPVRSVSKPIQADTGIDRSPRVITSSKNASGPPGTCKRRIWYIKYSRSTYRPNNFTRYCNITKCFWNNLHKSSTFTKKYFCTPKSSNNFSRTSRFFCLTRTYSKCLQYVTSSCLRTEPTYTRAEEHAKNKCKSSKI